jgi:tetratricopeptide (TPR) repeat protein
MLATVTLLALAQVSGPATATGIDDVVGLQCGSASDLSSVTDYRLANASPALQWSIADINRNHLDPAVELLNKRDVSRNVISDLSFILNHWPNHYPALQALIRYKLGGGDEDRDPYRSVECYFEIALQFVPNDANVLVLYGIYRYKSGDSDRAELYWKQALQNDPNSADAHYNLGLLYVEESRFRDALEHATKAYDLGYPLPGLKGKLIRAGYWKQLPEQ